MHVCPECGQRYPSAGYCAEDGKQLAQTDDPLLGSEIGRYRVARVLGEGGMGRVYLAVQPTIGSRVAIKLLSEECARNAELVERFFSEARAVNLIRHENIVGVLDLARLPDGRPFIVMEFVDGQTLASIVRRGPAPLGGIVQVMGEVLGALAAAHAIGIVHRDLKPDNVLITVEGHAKVLDFGIAKLSPGLSSNSPRTQTGALMGTPAYMAPEQISGSGLIDARTDVYAAGVVLFEAVTGRQPFAGATLFDLMRAHVEAAPPAPRSLRPDLPEAIETVILTALAKHPAQRFQSATAMAQALAYSASALPPSEWKPLSSRGGIMTPNITPSRNALEALRSTAVSPDTTHARRRMRRIVVPLIIAAFVVGGALLVVSKVGGGDEGAGSGSAAASGSAPGSATAPVAGSGSPAAAGSGSAAAPVAANDSAPVATPAKPAAHPPPAAPHPAPPPSAPPPAAKADSDKHGIAADAAKHGVIIGDNVHIGPGVVIGSNPPAAPASGPTTITKPADYDPAHFDPVTYLPQALALARQLAPDAQLSELEFDPVTSDGRVDLRKAGRDREYNFRSPARSAKPADVPRNVAYTRACMIHVELTPREITATLQTSETCNARLPALPHCHFASVWKQALAAGTPADFVARIGFLQDGTWFFDTDPDSTGSGGGVSTFADRCP